jgi:hypothetical protein
MKVYRITYHDGSCITAQGYNIQMALTSVGGQDFIQRIEEL